MKETALERIIKTGYKLLDLKTFLLLVRRRVEHGQQEKHIMHPNVQGIIHSDIEKGFIRAETIAYDDYIKFNGEQGSKNNGVWRQEGKDYLVEEGRCDIF